MPKEALAPVDPDVSLPPSVARAAAAADALHKRVYTPPQPDPALQITPPQPDPALQVQPQPQPDPPQPQPDPSQPQPDPPQPEPQPDNWEHRYLSMKGRFEQSQTTIGSMQQQMQELGDELMRTQRLITQPQQRPQPQAQPQRLLTDADTQTYGPELIDVIQRAAREAVAPDLQNVSQQVRQTSQRVAETAQGAVYNQLRSEVPDWQTINTSPRFKMWCGLPDLYSGQVRGQLLKAAFQAADAPRVIAFFKGFLDEEVATGQVVPVPQPQPGVQTPPRQAAVALDTLAAPGRAKPATGNSNAGAADKPVFTRAQIASFYDAVRKGQYAGRAPEKATLEAAIFAAQNDGRVRG